MTKVGMLDLVLSTIWEILFRQELPEPQMWTESWVSNGQLESNVRFLPSLNTDRMASTFAWTSTGGVLPSAK
jgi:hypothetical protein